MSRAVASSVTLVAALLLGCAGDPASSSPSTVQSIVERVGDAPSWDVETFDPGRLVAVVDALCAQPEEAVLAGLREACARSPEGADATHLFLLARVLFVPAETGTALPPVRLGATDDGREPGRLWPLLPIALEADVPLLVPSLVLVAGNPEDPRAHVDACARRGSLRRTPLRPPDDPFPIADRLLASARWYRPAGGREHDRARLRAQVLRLVAPVLEPPAQGAELVRRLEARPALWDELAARFRALGARWDAERATYVAP